MGKPKGKMGSEGEMEGEERKAMLKRESGGGRKGEEKQHLKYWKETKDRGKTSEKRGREVFCEISIFIVFVPTKF
jgi:hypothetical protein